MLLPLPVRLAASRCRCHSPGFCSLCPYVSLHLYESGEHHVPKCRKPVCYPRYLSFSIFLFFSFPLSLFLPLQFKRHSSLAPGVQAAIFPHVQGTTLTYCTGWNRTRGTLLIRLPPNKHSSELLCSRNRFLNEAEIKKSRFLVTIALLSFLYLMHPTKSGSLENATKKINV